MSCEGEKKCFTFIWKVKNASYCWQAEDDEFLDSPIFEIDEMEKTKWKLRLRRLFGDSKGWIGFWLDRDTDDKNVGSVQLDLELAFLASDGAILKSFKREAQTITKVKRYCGTNNFTPRGELFFERRLVFLPRNTLTVRCRIWKSAGEFSKEVQRYARTCVVVEKRSLLWNIEDFSTLESEVKRTYEIKSKDTDVQLISLELFVIRNQIADETIRISVAPNYKIVRASIFKLFVVDAFNNLVECFHDEFCDSSIVKKVFSIYLTEKSLYFPNDILSLQCEFSFSSGIVEHEFFSNISDFTSDENNESGDCYLPKENDLTTPKCILIDSLKSMVNNSCFSDVKLRTKTQTFAAHTFILGARSPVFKAMFSNDMKEKIKECVDIDDFNDDTVLRLLRYIYSADVEELNWDSAIQLYEAADKYELLDLKSICSSNLRRNLRPSNACEALVLADMHQDENLKVFVQDFILKHGKEVINSERWEQLGETNIKLAYETMRFKYKE